MFRRSGLVICFFSFFLEALRSGPYCRQIPIDIVSDCIKLRLVFTTGAEVLAGVALS